MDNGEHDRRLDEDADNHAPQPPIVAKALTNRNGVRHSAIVWSPPSTPAPAPSVASPSAMAQHEEAFTDPLMFKTPHDLLSKHVTRTIELHSSRKILPIEFHTQGGGVISRLSFILILGLIAPLTVSALADPYSRGAKGRAMRPPAAAWSASDDSYLVRYVIGPDGGRYPIMGLPGSATVVSRKVIDDQQATTLGQALENVSGVIVRGR